MNPNSFSSGEENPQESDVEAVLGGMPDYNSFMQQQAEREQQERKLELFKRQEHTWSEALRLHPNAVVEDAERGLYSFETPDGVKVYGSAYSILDMHDDLGRMSSRAEAIRTGSDENSLMGI